MKGYRHFLPVLIGILLTTVIAGATVFGLEAANERDYYDENYLKTTESVFSEELLTWEDFSEVEIRHDVNQRPFDPYGPYLPSLYVRRAETKDSTFVVRDLRDFINVEKDANNINFVQLVVPAGGSLTIEKGVTLTVSGEIIVQGKLVNKGTIVIDKDAVVSRNKDLGTDQCGFINEGEIKSSGNILIKKGGITNSAEGTMTNNGTITIETDDKNQAGLSVDIRSSKVVEKTGSFINNGTIHVNSQSGVGLSVANGAIFENKGAVNQLKGAKIEGELRGNKPVISEK